MKFHYHLLINPSAGSGNGHKVAEKILPVLKNKHVNYTPSITYVRRSSKVRYVHLDLQLPARLLSSKRLLKFPHPFLFI